jgi:DNA-binding LacI/PurR family transcriptional regulator
MGEYGGGARRPTISDIARLAGVSKGAVSYALNNRPGVSEATRARVLRIADELGWIPSSTARALSGARADAVGLVLSRSASSLGVDTFFMDFSVGLQSELAPHGVALLLQLVPDHAAAVQVYRRWWQGRRADGVLVMDLFDADERLPALRKLGLPALVVGGPEGVDGLDCLWSDDAGAMAAAIRYLAGLGHRRIARVAGPAHLHHTAARSASFHRTAAALGVGGVWTTHADFSDELGAAATRALLGATPRPTAIVYDNDVMAVSGLAVVAELGLSVPADVSLLAWDDSPLCRITRPALSAMSRDVTRFGAQAGRLLLSVVDGMAVGPVSGEPAVLAVRASTGPAPRD